MLFARPVLQTFATSTEMEQCEGRRSLALASILTPLFPEKQAKLRRARRLHFKQCAMVGFYWALIVLQGGLNQYNCDLTTVTRSTMALLISTQKDEVVFQPSCHKTNINILAEDLYSDSLCSSAFLPVWLRSISFCESNHKVVARPWIEIPTISIETKFCEP